MATKLRTRLKTWLAPAAGALVLLGAIYLHYAQPLLIEAVSLSVFDSYQRIKPRTQEDSAVLVVDIDESSLKARGQWPWPRTEIAELVKRLTNLGAAAIAFDIVFSEPDRTSPNRLADLLRSLDLLKEDANLESLPDNDKLLAEFLRQTPTIGGMILTHESNDRRPPLKRGTSHGGTDPAEYLPKFQGAVSNLDILDEAPPGLGYFSFEPDRVDRVVRRLSLVSALRETIYPSLVAEALRVAQGEDSIFIKSNDGSGEWAAGSQGGIVLVKVGQVVIPTNENGEVWIYYSGDRPGRVMSVNKILSADETELQTLQNDVAGKIILVGTSAPGLLDIRATPLSSSTAGVEVHAEVIEQILAGIYLTRPDWATGAERWAMIAAALALILLMPKIGPFWCAVLGGFIVAWSAGGSWYAFSQHQYLFDPVYPILGSTAVYLVVSGVLFLTAERERRSVRRAFSQYLAPEMVERLAEDPDGLKLGGEDKELTILFSDVRGFTKISEKLDSQQLTKLMNGFLTPMSDTLMEHGATIDKYIGDAIMAFWNAPLDVDGHAAKACSGALSMLERLDEVRADTGHDIQVGIGLNTGICSVGNFGSFQRFNYSALGDAVNLASRIEGLTKNYGVPILVGEATLRGAPGFAYLEADLIRVVGKQEPERVFALLGRDDLAGSADFKAMQEHHADGLAAFRSQKWDEAEAAFAKAQASASGGPSRDGIYHLYATRIADYRADPPPRNWDGVTDATSK
ncbi:MAG: adenylate/guanylate cyclase domain-containing protein [Pseudomonadota bacterium]